MKSEPCLYMWHDTYGALIFICSTHVDYFKICGEKTAVAKLKSGLETRIGKLKADVGEFEHCGIMHRQLADGSIVIHQNHYVSQLSALPLDKTRELESLCSTSLP